MARDELWDALKENSKKNKAERIERNLKMSPMVMDMLPKI